MLSLPLRAGTVPTPGWSKIVEFASEDSAATTAILDGNLGRSFNPRGRYAMGDMSHHFILQADTEETETNCVSADKMDSVCIPCCVCDC